MVLILKFLFTLWDYLSICLVQTTFSWKVCDEVLKSKMLRNKADVLDNQLIS